MRSAETMVPHGVSDPATRDYAEKNDGEHVWRMHIVNITFLSILHYYLSDAEFQRTLIVTFVTSACNFHVPHNVRRKIIQGGTTREPLR